jgi:raffinose/stachyose/melibiose transport system permease protein
MSSAAEVAPAAALPQAVVPRTDQLIPRAKPKGGIGMTILLAILAIFWISPLALLVITAVRPLADFVANGPLSWPETFTLSNFADAWGIGNFGTTYRNSMFLLLLKTPVGVLVSAMLAYALAKLRIRFGTAIMYTVFLGLTIPIYITIVPVFVMMRSIGATDSVFGLVGPYLAFGIPFEVLVLQSTEPGPGGSSSP